MSKKRIINIWYDIVNRMHRDSSGAQIRFEDYPYITYTEKPTVRLRIVTDENLTAWTDLDGSEEYSASIDNDFNHDSSSALMCKTLNANINVAGDWVAGGQADPGAGEWSIRLDADNSNYQGKIASYQELAGTKFELLAFEAGSGDLVSH